MSGPLRSLVTILSLGIATICAARAYHVNLDLPEEQLAGKTLSQDTGWTSNELGEAIPIGKKNEAITIEMLDALRAARRVRPQENGPRIKLREFSWRHWNERWYFLASVGLLALMGLLGRSSGAKKPRDAAVSAPETAIASQSVGQLFAGLETELTSALYQKTSGKELSQVIDRCQKEYLQPLIAAAEQVSGGAAGRAKFLAALAAVERAINRAWSAAIDGYNAEAAAALQRSVELLPDVKSSL